MWELTPGLLDSSEGSVRRVFHGSRIFEAEVNETVETEEPGEIKSCTMKDNKKEDLEDSRSEDPFKIYDILEKIFPKKCSKPDRSGAKYPAGVTPANSSGLVKANHVHGTIEKEHGDKQDFKKEATLKEEAGFSVNSGHFETASFPKTGGSMLYLIEELIKVGQVMGYKMEGCMNDMEEIETKMENVDLFDIRSCWGNLSFDYVVGPSVGNSGDGFDSFVSEAWKGINVDDSNDMLKLAKKLKILKGLICSWVKDKKDKTPILKNSLKKKIADIDALLDNEIV
ncbi:hypothetical protein Tco_0133339 [Tanacetum coccineum]